MVKTIIVIAMIILLSGCSGDSDTADREGENLRATDVVAEKMVQGIKKPIHKAEAVKELSEQRGKELEEQAGD